MTPNSHARIEPHLFNGKIALRTVQTPKRFTTATAAATATLQQEATTKSQATALSNIIRPIMLYKIDQACYPSGSLWEPLGAYGRFWEPLGAFGSFWKLQEAFGSLWEPLKASRSL